MGHVKIDIQEKDRKYTQTYALNTPKGSQGSCGTGTGLLSAGLRATRRQAIF
ncbi:hypothetical protein [Paenibacillus larvae]|uniref:hypothetical protein n=1 Tax=Paenibacillus larvae TaxID=1464 RepID=UPI0016627F39|nr:hypothetical protein [Paenibacillus larvae]